MKKIVFLPLLLLLCAAPLFAQDSKPTLLILNTAAIDVEESKSSIVQNYIVDFIHRSGDFAVVERSHLEEAVKEMELSMSGIVDEETAVEIGRFTGAKYILLSSLAFSDEKYHLSMRVVSVETAKITNTSVKSIRTFSNIDRIVDDSVSYLFGKGLEPESIDTYLTLELDFSLGFPQGPPSEVLGFSYLPKMVLDYNWGLSWGVLCIGLAAGCNITGTLENTISEYDIYSVLTGLSLGYRTAFNSPVNGYIDLIPGAGFSFLIYPPAVTGGEAIIFKRASFAAVAEAGAVFNLSDNYMLKGFGSFTYVVLSADDLILIAPGVGIIYRF